MKKVNFQSIIKLILSASLDNSHELLAPLEVLEGKTALETCKNLWYFVKNNIKYHLDKAGTEQIRTPKRTWEDRRNGVDCEDYSIFIAAALLYWNIPCSFRIADYGNGYQHIYVFTQDCILDCCEVAFNQEQAFVRKLDIPVQANAERFAPSVELPLQVAALSGPGDSKEEILKYEGKGGKGKQVGADAGILSQYFTPEWVIDLMWQLVKAHGFSGGNVLEPSCGSGRFMHYAPTDLNMKFTAFERDIELANMAKKLVPQATIYSDFFETAFLQKKGAFWHTFPKNLNADQTWLEPMDLVIGNPPYGIWKNQYSAYFNIQGVNQIEQLFMLQGLKVLKQGGLMCYITASAFASTNDKYAKTKDDMGKLCKLVDAYRLPSVFKNTDVPTDILIFQKT